MARCADLAVHLITSPDAGKKYKYDEWVVQETRLPGVVIGADDAFVIPRVLWGV
jgi:hypothetical protein